MHASAQILASPPVRSPEPPRSGHPAPNQTSSRSGSGSQKRPDLVARHSRARGSGELPSQGAERQADLCQLVVERSAPAPGLG